MTTPTISESLAGRIDLVTLWPLSVGEVAGGGDDWSIGRSTRHGSTTWRDATGLEVDAVLEAADGRVVTIEVKSSTIARTADAAPMAFVRDRLDKSATTSLRESSSTQATAASDLATDSSARRPTRARRALVVAVRGRSQ